MTIYYLLSTTESWSTLALANTPASKVTAVQLCSGYRDKNIYTNALKIFTACAPWLCGDHVTHQSHNHCHCPVFCPGHCYLRPLLSPRTALGRVIIIYHEKIYYAYNKNISPGSSVRQPVSQRNVWARVRAEMRVLQRRGLWPRVGHVPLSTWLHGRQGEYCIS